MRDVVAPSGNDKGEIPLHGVTFETCKRYKPARICRIRARCFRGIQTQVWDARAACLSFCFPSFGVLFKQHQAKSKGKQSERKEHEVDRRVPESFLFIGTCRRAANPTSQFSTNCKYTIFV